MKVVRCFVCAVLLFLSPRSNQQMGSCSTSQGQLASGKKRKLEEMLSGEQSGRAESSDAKPAATEQKTDSPELKDEKADKLLLSTAFPALLKNAKARRLSDKPEIWAIDDVLSAKECEQLINAALSKGLTRSSTTSGISDSRTSHGVNLKCCGQAGQLLEKRVSSVLNLDSTFEECEVLRSEEAETHQM